MDIDSDPTAALARSAGTPVLPAPPLDAVPALFFFAGVCRATAALLDFVVAVVRETHGGIDPIHLEPGILRTA